MDSAFRRRSTAEQLTDLPMFDGPDVTESDEKRLGSQLEDVQRAMIMGAWRTLAELSKATGHPEASCSARLRDLRKPRFGSYTVQRRRRSPGQWEYRLVKP